MSTEDSRELDRVVSQWIARRDSGDWSDHDEAQFSRWLQQSDLHQIAWLRMQRIWDETRRLSALGAGIPSGRIPQRGQWVLTPFYDSPTRPEDADSPIATAPVISRIGRRSIWAIAASIVLATTLFAFRDFSLPGERYSTPIGGVSSLPLADGSKITLNTASRIRVELTGTERRAELQRGEAFFDVARDSSRPFVVTAGRKRIVVLGTKFSVRRDGEDIRVVVTEGAVQLENADAPRSAKAERLVAGTVAVTAKAGTVLRHKALDKVEEELSWRAGVLVFRDETLAGAIAEFNRYTVRKIRIVDARVAGMRVAGSFQSNNAEDFVRLLEQGYALRVDSSGDEILLNAR